MSDKQPGLPSGSFQTLVEITRERDELRAEVERLRATVETAVAMVRSTDSDLADALLRSLAKPKE